jgi:hypothetical protein
MTHSLAPIVLHAGTGGSAAQDIHRCLTANAASLGHAGFPLLDAAGSTRPAAPRFPRQLTAGLVSDPSLCGSTAGLLTGSFFAGAADRVRDLATRHSARVTRLVLAVQPYDVLFRAAWRQAALAGPAQPFDRAMSRMAAMQEGWHDLVVRLSDALDGPEITVLAAPLSPRRIIDAVVPRLDLPVLRPFTPSPAITDSAVAALQRMQAQGVTLAPGQIDRLCAFHAALPQAQTEIALNALALADLRGRYVADLAMLARMQGIRVEAEAQPLPVQPARRAIAAE